MCLSEYLNVSLWNPILGKKLSFWLSACTRALQKVLSLGSDYFSAKFYQTYFYYKPSKYSPFTEIQFCILFTQSQKKQINSLLVSVGDIDK